MSWIGPWFCAAYGELEQTGEVTGLRRYLLRCLLPTPLPSDVPDMSDTDMGATWERAGPCTGGALPGLLGNEKTVQKK